jgi:hypothetical protein
MSINDKKPNKLIQPTRNTRGANSTVMGRSADYGRSAETKSKKLFQPNGAALL